MSTNQNTGPTLQGDITITISKTLLADIMANLAQFSHTAKNSGDSFSAIYTNVVLNSLIELVPSVMDEINALLDAKRTKS